MKAHVTFKDVSGKLRFLATENNMEEWATLLSNQKEARKYIEEITNIIVTSTIFLLLQPQSKSLMAGASQ